MAANNMSNAYVSPDVLSTLMLFQQGKLYNLQQQMHGISRSSRLEVFCKKAAVKTYAKFTGKHLYWESLFNKVAGLQANICKRLLLHHKYYNPPPNIAKQ